MGDNTKMYLKEIWCEGGDCMHLADLRNKVTNVLVSQRTWNFLNYLVDYQFIRKDSTL
jgi:hypothetical protein